MCDIQSQRVGGPGQVPALSADRVKNLFPENRHTLRCEIDGSIILVWLDVVIGLCEILVS